MTSLMQTAEGKMAALTVVISRLSDVDFKTKRARNLEKTAMCIIVQSIPVDRTRGASSVRFLFNETLD